MLCVVGDAYKPLLDENGFCEPGSCAPKDAVAGDEVAECAIDEEQAAEDAEDVEKRNLGGWVGEVECGYM